MLFFQVVLHFRKFWYSSVTTLLIVLAGMISFTACKDENGDGDLIPPEQKPCMLINFNTSDESESSFITSTSEYTYDEDGNQTGITFNHSWKSRIDGSTTTQKIITASEYDDKGFLLHRTAEYTDKGVDDVVTVTNETSDYVYANERLVKIDFKRIQNGVTNSNVITYEYNGDGKLIKYTNNLSYITVQYNGTTPSKISWGYGGGPSTVPTLEFNSKGFMTRVFIDNGDGNETEYRYQYDDYGQVTRGEHYYKGKPTYAYDQQYDDKPSVLNFMTPPIKGQPYVPSQSPEIIRRNNVVKSIWYEPTADFSGWQVTNESTFQLDYTVNGLLLRESVSSAYKGKGEGTGQKLYVFRCR